jgi:hypothetical protein
MLELEDRGRVAEHETSDVYGAPDDRTMLARTVAGCAGAAWDGEGMSSVAARAPNTGIDRYMLHTRPSRTRTDARWTPLAVRPRRAVVPDGAGGRRGTRERLRQGA